MKRFVPDSFEPPVGLDAAAFRLRPLGRRRAHIRTTPGFAGLSWPREMTLEENMADLFRHAADFAARTGFTYTVLDVAGADGAGGTVIGCVYIYPSELAGVDAEVRSWVRAADASLDLALYRAVADWLGKAWPFAKVEYAARQGA